jgi:hypothetical protein
VWQQQKEADLQAAILEELLSHRAYMTRLRWLRVPAIFLLERWVAALREARSSLELGTRNSKADFELRFDIPGIQWQRHLERITAHRTAGGTSVVVVLDELDRATPAVTQAALTLARRSVGIPGVTAVIPYVRSQIRYKVFNPLQTVLPDLESSMDAVLYDDCFGRSPDDDPDGTYPATILQFWDDLRAKFQMSQPDGAQPVGKDRPTARGFLGKPPSGDHALAMVLRFGIFGNASRQGRERLQRLFEEKYLSPAGITVRPPGPKDLAVMVTTHFPALVRMVSRLLPPPLPGQQPEPSDMRNAVQSGLENWLKKKPKLIKPPIRALLGVLHDNVTRAVSLAEDKGVSLAEDKDRALSPQDVATLIVAAYDAAALVYGTGGGSS